MMVIDIEDYVKSQEKRLLIDVRSPSEHAKGHIPGSINIPLLNDEERKEIGTIYKQESRKKAIRRGLDFFGPKMRDIVEKIDEITTSTDSTESSRQQVTLYCWRGGMRSNTIGWLLNTYGYDVTLIRGGYKSYRQWCKYQFEETTNIILLGGYTGTGKTHVLSVLKKLKLPVIDLEYIAKHRGSAFGGIGMDPQPTQETFENILALSVYVQKEEHGYVIMEDECQRIGTVSIPSVFWEQMKRSSLLFLKLGFRERIENILEEYGKLDRSLLAAAIIRLQKKLGGLETKECLGYLVNKDYNSSFTILLRYYDKLYHKSLEQKKTTLGSFYENEFDVLDQKAIFKIHDSIKKLSWK